MRSRVLIIDNEPANLQLLSDCLAEMDVEVLVAVNGREGLEVTRLAKPDLVLLDIKMPGIDGYEVCTRLKSDPALCDIPVIFLSSLFDTSDKIRGFEAGAVDFISKPFQTSEVLIRVRTHLSLRQASLHLEKLVEERTKNLQTVSRMLEILGDCNQSVLLATDEDALREEICGIISGKGGYPCVWIGIAEKDEFKTVRPVAWAEEDRESLFMEELKVSWGDGEFGRGPTGRAIREGRTVYMGDFLKEKSMAPWLEPIKAGTFLSGISIPFRDEAGNAFGALTIYSREQSDLNHEEIRLIEKVAANLTYGILSIRSRIAHEESERKYRLIVDTASEGIASVGPDDRINFVNSRMLEMLGYGEREMIGRDMADFIHKDQLKDFRLQMKNRRKGFSETFERCFTRKSGDPLWTDASAVPVRSEEGEYCGSFAMFTDISEIRNNRERLRILEFAVNHIGEAIYLADDKGNIIFANEAAGRSLGYSHEEFLSMSIGDIDPSWTSSIGGIPPWEEISAGSTATFTTRHRSKNGRIIPVEIISTRIEYMNAKYYLSLVNDITDRNRTSEIKKLIGLSAEINRELSSIVSDYDTADEPPTLSDLGFTSRQVEIARMIIEGSPTKAIALDLNLSEPTIKSHLSTMYRKLEVSGRMEFSRKIVEMGILLE